MRHRSISSRIRDLLGMKSVPEGHIAVYVGETSMSRFMIPISYLNHPLFEGLLHLAEEEFGFDHPGVVLKLFCHSYHKMCIVGLTQANRKCHRSVSSRIWDLLGTKTVPKGHIAVDVGETSKNRFIIPISYFNHPLFEGLLNLAEEEFGFNHPTGSLTIPCSKGFISLTRLLKY
ncbi:hypothetical protein Gotur_007564 [Gossypium turneri]